MKKKGEYKNACTCAQRSPERNTGPVKMPSFLIVCADSGPCNHRTLEPVFCVVKVVSPSGSHLLSSMTLATLTATVGSMWSGRGTKSLWESFFVTRWGTRSTSVTTSKVGLMLGWLQETSSRHWLSLGTSVQTSFADSALRLLASYVCIHCILGMKSTINWPDRF